MTSRLTLAECAAKAREVREIIDMLRILANRYGLTIDKYHDIEGLLLGVEVLMGQVWAGFHGSANDERAKCGQPLVRPFTDLQRERAESIADKCRDVVAEGRLVDQDRDEAEEGDRG